MYPFFGVKPPLLLYPFRYVSDRTGKWVRARYVAELHEIAARHKPGEWAIDGPPEVRSRGGAWTYFNPFANARAHLPPVEEPPPSDEPPRG
jgi:hypothetical protein